MIGRIKQVLSDILWPRGVKCLCCDNRSEGELLCSTCKRSLRALRLIDEDAGENMRSVYRHDGTAKELVWRLKYDCLADTAVVLAEDMAEAVRCMNLPGNTVFTWVSMPEKRLKERGIDHGCELCTAVAQRCGFPVQQLLSRKGSTHTQRGLNREARLKNLQNTIECNVPVKAPVLLIDDVMTTGATASACISALENAGAPAVYVLTATKAVLTVKM